MKPPRVVVLTVPAHLYANQLLVHLLQTREVAAVFESAVLLHGQTFVRALARYWRTAGPRYVALQGAKQWGYRLACAARSVTRSGRPGDVFYDYRRLARARGVPVAPLADVNSGAFRARLQALAPEVVVSAYFNQILDPATAGVAPGGAVNVHPAALPAYRGVSPVFWALAHGEPRVGVSVHRIDAGIDTGAVLARAELAVEPSDTEHSLYLRLTRAALPLLDAVLDGLAAGEPPTVPAPGRPSYHSLPTRAAVAEFRRRGRRFF